MKEERKGGSLLNRMKQLQDARGYLAPADINTLAEEFSVTVTQIYETASFYHMLRFEPSGRYVIQICRSAPCHVAGAAQVIKAMEQALGIRVGETTADGRYTLEYTECIGQCQNGPSMLINGKPCTGITPDQVGELLERLGKEDCR